MTAFSDGETLVMAHEGREAYLNLWDIPPRARVHWAWTAFLALVATGVDGGLVVDKSAEVEHPGRICGRSDLEGTD